MDSNKTVKKLTRQEAKTLDSLALKISKIKDSDEISTFFKEIFTTNELKNLSLRWRLLELLTKSVPQRDIATQLKISLCKITRGSRILKEKKSVTKKLLKI